MGYCGELLTGVWNSCVGYCGELLTGVWNSCVGYCGELLAGVWKSCVGYCGELLTRNYHQDAVVDCACCRSPNIFHQGRVQDLLNGGVHYLLVP